VSIRSTASSTASSANRPSWRRPSGSCEAKLFTSEKTSSGRPNDSALIDTNKGVQLGSVKAVTRTSPASKDAGPPLHDAPGHGETDKRARGQIGLLVLSCDDGGDGYVEILG
jgi:hypothetical protein